MIQAEFIRDMHNNYLILNGLDENLSGYHVKMLLNNTIEGLLNVELRCIDQMNLFYYDITSFKSIADVYEKKFMDYDEIKFLLKGILCTLEKIGEYLLSENDCIIYPEYIYVDITTQTVHLCHLIGLQENVQEQLSKFMEYLMDKVDYKDERAVLLIYAMYKISREQDCTFQKLLIELNKNYNEISENITQNRGKFTKEKSDLRENSLDVIESKEKEYKLGNKKAPCKQVEDVKKITLKNKDKNRYIKKDVLKTSTVNNQINNFKKRLFTQIGLNNKSSKSKHKIVNELTHCNRTCIIPEEIENDHEICYYSFKTYSMATVSLVVGVGFVTGAIQWKFVHNSFGTKIDIVKLFCCCIIIIMAEVLIMSKLFDDKNQLTRMETNLEYVAPNNENLQEETNQELISQEAFGGSSFEEVLSKRGKTKENVLEETTILWSKAKDISIEPTRILALFQQKKYYLEIKDTLMAEVMEDSYKTVIKILDRVKFTDEINENIQTRVFLRVFPFTIGKSKENVTMSIDDSSVSRKHAVISREGEDIFITDLKSTNGTYLNGNRIEPNKPYQLSINDEVTISLFKFILREA